MMTRQNGLPRIMAGLVVIIPRVGDDVVPGQITTTVLYGPVEQHHYERTFKPSDDVF